MWVGSALLKRKVAVRVGPWTSEVKTITPGLPQGSALSPVLFNVYCVHCWHHIKSTGGTCSNLGRECREWDPGEIDRAVETLINENSRENDAVVLLMARLRGEKSGSGE